MPRVTQYLLNDVLYNTNRYFVCECHLCAQENGCLSKCYSGYILVPVDDSPFVLVEKFHRFVQQHVLYCIGQAHAGSSLRVYYPHRASSGHCHGMSRSREVTVLYTCQDKKFFTIPGCARLLNFVSIHARFDWYSHSITMEAFTPTPYKTAKIPRFVIYNNILS